MSRTKEAWDSNAFFEAFSDEQPRLDEEKSRPATPKSPERAPEPSEPPENPEVLACTYRLPEGAKFSYARDTAAVNEAIGILLEESWGSGLGELPKIATHGARKTHLKIVVDPLPVDVPLRFLADVGYLLKKRFGQADSSPFVAFRVMTRKEARDVF